MQPEPNPAPADPNGPTPQPRRKTLRWLIFALVPLAAITALVLWVSSLAEPEYKGVKLSVWLERYNNEVDAEPQRDDAVLAIRQIGLQALPVALRWLSNSDSKLKLKLIGLANRQPAIKFRFVSAEEYHDRGFETMRLLGPDGKSAIPALEKLLRRPETAESAAAVLCLYGQDALSALTRGLTNNNPEIRRETVHAMRGFATVQVETPKGSQFKRILLPDILILKLRQDSEREVREFAINEYWQAATSAGASEALSKIAREGLVAAHPTDSNDTSQLQMSDGGIIRGPRTEKRIALVFTAHTFAEGGDTILRELAKHQAKASFFVTGDFLDSPKFKSLAKRIINDGHYLGPHSDKHLLYCPWEGPKKTLVGREEFESDLNHNLDKIARLGIPRSQITYWLPAYEWYNRDIVDWSKAMGLTLVNYTPGTRANADYLEDTAKNFISSKTIIESIEKKEQTDPNGLNGFLLLMHLGVGPARADKLSDHLGELLDYLGGEGYQFVRVDELLNNR